MGSIELYSSMCFVPSLQSVVSLLEVMQHNHLWSQNEYYILIWAQFSLKSFLSQRRCAHWHFSARKWVFSHEDSNSWLKIWKPINSILQTTSCHDFTPETNTKMQFWKTDAVMIQWHCTFIGEFHQRCYFCWQKVLTL